MVILKISTLRLSEPCIFHSPILQDVNVRIIQSTPAIVSTCTVLAEYFSHAINKLYFDEIK